MKKFNTTLPKQADNNRFAKDIFTLMFTFFVYTGAQAQQPIDGTKHTDKSAADMTKVSKTESGSTPNDRSAGAGGSLTVENSKKNKEAVRKKRQVPDGSYGTNRTGMPYSANPNYPYDRNGKLIQSKDIEIITAPKSGQNTSQDALPHNTATRSKN